MAGTTTLSALVVILALTVTVSPFGARSPMAPGEALAGGRMMGGMMGGSMMRNTEPRPAANGAAGATIFEQDCAGCHTIQAGAANGIGPNLHGLFGRKAGGGRGYAYSAAMRTAGIVWSARTLDAFIAAPQDVVPGNKMPFAGISEAEQRQRLVAYLEAATK